MSARVREVHRAWTDLFGSLLATVEGRPGGGTTLVLVPPEHAAEATTVLLELDAFRGRAALGVPERAHAAPVAAVLRALEPRAVVVVEPRLDDGVASAGPSVPGDAGPHEASSGLWYVEPDRLPAWDAGWLRERFPDAPTALSELASAAAGARAVIACGPAALAATLGRVLAER